LHKALILLLERRCLHRTLLLRHLPRSAWPRSAPASCQRRHLLLLLLLRPRSLSRSLLLQERHLLRVLHRSLWHACMASTLQCQRKHTISTYAVPLTVGNSCPREYNHTSSRSIHRAKLRMNAWPQQASRR